MGGKKEEKKFWLIKKKVSVEGVEKAAAEEATTIDCVLSI